MNMMHDKMQPRIDQYSKSLMVRITHLGPRCTHGLCTIRPNDAWLL